MSHLLMKLCGLFLVATLLREEQTRLGSQNLFNSFGSKSGCVQIRIKKKKLQTEINMKKHPSPIFCIYTVYCSI